MNFHSVVQNFVFFALRHHLHIVQARILEKVKILLLLGVSLSFIGTMAGHRAKALNSVEAAGRNRLEVEEEQTVIEADDWRASVVGYCMLSLFSSTSAGMCLLLGTWFNKPRKCR
jgi:hypothetical protein